MTNPIAFVIRPSRAFLLCMSLFAGYGVMLGVTCIIDGCPCIVDADEAFDGDNLSPVELLE